MRRNRRGAGSGLEFGGSGEDSFVAVVVTKLTGALLFILLLSMVIMALLPKAVDLGPAAKSGSAASPAAAAAPLAITTPSELPEAIAGHRYAVALAASGGQGPLRWSLDGPLPKGLSFDTSTGVIQGTPAAGTAQPLSLAIRVGDGRDMATRAARLLVYQSDTPLSTPAWWKPGLPPVPWRAWLDQGVGFLILWLVHLVGMSSLSAYERSAGASAEMVPNGTLRLSVARRFSLYRHVIRLGTLSSMAGLVVWLWVIAPR